MKTYLEFHDATSAKFWQIEVQDVQHTVTFGKINTDGQSKNKTFTTAEDCLKDAEKLIKTKKAKGYAELGETAIIPEKKSKPSNNSKDKNPTKSNKQEALDALDHLIRSGTIEDVIPFIQQYHEGNSTALNQALKKAKRYWCDYQDLSKDPQFINRNNKYSSWGQRGKERHTDIIHLLGFALLNESDSKSTWNFLSYLDYREQKQFFIDQLKLLKPTWLGHYLKQTVIDNPWTLNYELIRQLEDDGLVEFDPQLFGIVVQHLSQYRMKDQKLKGLPTIQYYLQDDTLVKRDIPLMFDYETRPQDHNFGNWRNEDYAWQNIFIALIQHHAIERQFALQKIIEIQTKDWNTQTKSFFKKVFADLNVSVEDLLPLQDHLFVLLHSEFSATVGFALENIKIIYQHTDFKLSEYLEWFEPLMMRSDLKSQVKTIILQLQNLLKAKTPYDQQVFNLLADVFLQNDLNLQERSAKLLLKYQDQINDDIRAKIVSYQDNLLGDVKIQLKDLFNQNTEDADLDTDLNFSASLFNYHYQIPKIDYLDDSKKVELIESWQDLVFFMWA